MPYMPYGNYYMESQEISTQQFGFFPYGPYGFNPWFGFGSFFFPFLLGALLF